MTYLEKVQRDTSTKFWVNNPSIDECDVAIANGAFSCTTNPSYCAKLFQSDPTYIRKKIKTILDKPTKNVSIAEQVYHSTTKDLMDRFLPMFKKTNGKQGFVTVQEDPRFEENHDYIIEASLRAKDLGPNYMAKIPVTEHGLAVISAMVENNVPICATEVFSISQAVLVYNIYKEASKKHSKTPPIFITHITGIMDQYFKDLVVKENISISNEALKLAGTAVCLKQYNIFKQNNFNAIILGGGARGLEHFTNFVGGDMHITINWSTALELNESYNEVEVSIDRKISDNIIDELLDKLPNFKRAWDENAMEIDEFADYGPVMLFRTQFMNGYSRLIDEINIK